LAAVNFQAGVLVFGIVEISVALTDLGSSFGTVVTTWTVTKETINQPKYHFHILKYLDRKKQIQMI